MTMVGILGGGQLARMLALAAHPLGLRCRVLDPAATPPAGAIAEHVRGEFDDPGVIERFSENLTVATFEIEHVLASVVQKLETQTIVRPSASTQAIVRDRLTQKQFLNSCGIATAPFVAIKTECDLNTAIDTLGLPLVLKTRTHGFDGRGQSIIRSREDIARVWRDLGERSLLAEAFVPFERELSIVAVRSAQGEMRCYAVGQNHHHDGILQWTIAPAPNLHENLRRDAERIVTDLADALDYVGVLTVELFEIADMLVVNEVAARVHNSGHWTIEGSATSQFENHLRAIVGWPLGSTQARGVSVLVNLIGATPDITRFLELPDTHVHLYDKAPKPSRKIGHVTACVRDSDEAERLLGTLMEIVRPEAPPTSTFHRPFATL